MSSQALPLDTSPKNYRPVEPLSPAEDAKAQQHLKDEGNLPRHIAIIMDGDRRWADAHNLPRTDGHRTNWGGEQPWYPSDHYPVIAELEFEAPPVAGKRAHDAV